MKLVRVRATDLDNSFSKKDKNRNSIHMYTVESNFDDVNIEKVDKDLSAKFASDGNFSVSEGHTSIFYINIDQVAVFKKYWKELKTRYKKEI